MRRHNLVGDIGRRVCEAMAGYMTFHEGKDPAENGVPSDQFVEICCRDYSRQGSQADGSADADPNAEEKLRVGDVADTLMEEWLAGSDRERKLWGQMRDWVMEGHERTLARLGTTMDHCDFESENIQRAVSLLEEGVESGVLEREDSGAVVYRTERSEYPTIVLIREDGFPTEHARLLGTYDRILDELEPGEPYMEVTGLEWQPPVTALCEVHALLRPGSRNETHTRFYHASVISGEGEKIGSSTGDVLWIDDFVDQVAATPGVSALEARGDGMVPREQIADILVRGTFLCWPASKPLAFAPGSLLEERSGPGWTIAEAWCRAQHAEGQGEDSIPVARTTVMQSQQYWRCLRRVVEKRDITSLARYLLSVSEGSLEAPSPGPAAAPVLGRVLNSLGFLAGKSHSDSAPEPVAARPEAGLTVS